MKIILRILWTVIIFTTASCSNSSNDKDILTKENKALKDSLENLWGYVDILETKVFGEASSRPKSNPETNLEQELPVYVFSAIAFKHKEWSTERREFIISESVSLTSVEKYETWTKEHEFRLMDKHEAQIMREVDYKGLVERKCYKFKSYEEASKARLEIGKKVQGVD